MILFNQGKKKEKLKKIKKGKNILFMLIFTKNIFVFLIKPVTTKIFFF